MKPTCIPAHLQLDLNMEASALHYQENFDLLKGSFSEKYLNGPGVIIN